jgi:peptidylprolyl isomerase/peptidyl-prolyl cis-trans isomerase B (cyclophilin B)
MKAITIIPLALLLFQLWGCAEESSKTPAERSTETAKEKEEEVAMQESETAEILTPEKRVELALSVREKEISLADWKTATIETSKGAFVMEFYPKDAPNTTKNFIRLAQVGFYDGLTFHRYVPDFVIQGGDPRGDGTGNAGYNLNAEFSERKHVTGTVAMARSADPNSASCQFYVTLSPKPHLDGKYTVFGQVIEGMDVVNQLRAGDVIKTITIE